MQINIECEYCGSVHDFSKHRTCPRLRGSTLKGAGRRCKSRRKSGN